MKSSYSLLQKIQADFPEVRLRTYFKASLTALSHAMEDMLLVGDDQALVIACFQQGRFYRREARRYQRIEHKTDQIYVLAVGDSDFFMTDSSYPQVFLHPDDALAHEWHLIILGTHYASSIICQESAVPVLSKPLDSMRQFRGIWSFDRELCRVAAMRLLDHLAERAPSLQDMIHATQNRYQLADVHPDVSSKMDRVLELDAKLFTDRLVTYLQASQHRQLKAYRTISTQQEQQRLIHSIANTLRRSLQPEEILNVAIAELGKVFSHCRCLIYQVAQDNQPITLAHEAVSDRLPTLRGSNWSIATHPLFQTEIETYQTVAISDVLRDSGVRLYPQLRQELIDWGIGACLLIPIVYQDRCLGFLEIHQPTAYLWSQADINFLEAIATQAGIALLQGQAFKKLEQANTKLMAMERTQRGLIAIVGHELKTPLSAIQICLETLATSSPGLLDYHQEMLAIAIESCEQLKQLIQDFLLLSQLGSGSDRWNIEPIAASEYINLAASKFINGTCLDCSAQSINLSLDLPPQLPMIEIDGEAFMIVLSKLLENSFKFTEKGSIRINAEVVQGAKRRRPDFNVSMLQISVIDTGVGIEAEQLEKIFEEFFQEEDYIRRQVGGVGLGLSICRQIIAKMGGELWAISAGKNQGSQFKFTVPIWQPSL